MSAERNPLSDKELWRSFATDRPPAPAVVSDLDFAAWLEGRLSESEAGHVEAAIAADPELRRAALELSDILGKPLPVAPPRMAVRAQALVGFEAERQVARGGGWLGGLMSLGASFGVPRAALATAAVAIAVSGFMLGGGLGESFAEQKYVVASNEQATSATNELTSFFATDGI
jgi:anti-sigma factor RsiW